MDAIATRRRLLSLVPLQLAVLLIGLREARRAALVPQIAGWLTIAGVLLTLIGYALAVRRAARVPD
jgi:hypothetical protein